MNDEDLSQLVSGGEITLHSHPHTITLDQYHRMQQLETIRYVNATYTVKPDDDYIFIIANTAINIYLPSSNSGRILTFSRTQNSGNVTLIPISGEYVNGGSTLIISTSFSPKRLKGVKGYGFVEV